ncbi:MAG: T9SS type A sorting domain-containing protein [Candidatus Kapabacteria bacterium]|nr:T9SS type A sorting domain-containing protein [Ignavibacteriota bacterium]MCW5884764.1 T9SS type A sorting domain-containing protein [Candidatus Kapabacteria bacterium]
MKDLDRLFDDISKTNLPEFPFNDSEIRKTLTNIDKQKKTNIFNKRGVVVMSIFSSILIVFVSLMMIQNTTDIVSNNEVLSNFNSIQVAPESKINISEQNQVKNIASNDTPKSPRKQIENSEKNDEPNNTNRNGFNSIEKMQKNLTSEEREKLNKHLGIDPIDTNIAKNVNGNITIHYYKKDLPKDELDSIDVLVLSDDELERINIRKVDCGYLFLTESIYPSYNLNQFKDIPKYMYPDKGIVRMLHLVNDSNKFQLSYLKNPDWDMSLSPGIFPECLRMHRGDSTGTTYSTTSFGTSVINSFGSNKILKDIINNYVYTGKLQSDLRKILGPDGKVSSIKIYYDKTKNPNINAGVPVFLRVNTEERTNYIIVTYLATENFINLLPDRYKRSSHNKSFENLLSNIDQGLIHKQFVDAVAEIKEPCNFSQPQLLSKPEVKEIKQIAGIEKLTLSFEEAEKIGIFKKGDTISCSMEEYINIDNVPPGGLKMINEVFGYDTTKQHLLLKSTASSIMYNSDENTKGIRVKPVRYSGWDYTIWSEKAALGVIYQSVMSLNGIISNQVTMTQISQSPFLLSDTTNDDYIDVDKILTKDSLGKYKPLIHNLLPVNFHWEEYNGDDTIRYDVDIWFYVSKEFAELLPERYRTPILNELEIISRVEDGSLSPDDACKALKGEISYLGVCKLSNNLLESLNIYPNPLSGDNINISFAPKRNCNLRFELYSHEGKFISTLSESKSYSTYINSLNFNVGNISQGIYFISISDDKGNVVNEKFVKVK